MRTRILSVAVLAPALAACDATIVLGTDCPPLRSACPVEDGSLPDPADAEGPEGPDSSGADASEEPRDAATPPPDLPDAHVEAGPTLFPELQNGSFELTNGGVEGELDAFEMPSPIAPWYACRTGLSVTSSVRAQSASVEPTDGATFVGDSFPIVALNLNGLNQDLRSPLKAGQRYAFVVDVWSEGVLGNVLELHVVNGAGCVPTVGHLATSGPLRDGVWQRSCIAFTPSRDVTTVGLMASAPEEYLNIGARLYVDNIRSEPDCH